MAPRLWGSRAEGNIREWVSRTLKLDRHGRSDAGTELSLPAVQLDAMVARAQEHTSTRRRHNRTSKRETVSDYYGLVSRWAAVVNVELEQDARLPLFEELLSSRCPDLHCKRGVFAGISSPCIIRKRNRYVNCKSGRQLEATQSRHLDTSVSSMNDELLHTAYLPMAYCLLVLCMTPAR
jgi:hypothetical protein